MRYVTILADETLFGTKYKSDLNKPNSVYQLYTPSKKQIEILRLKPGTQLCINTKTKKLYYYKDSPIKKIGGGNGDRDRHKSSLITNF